MEDQNSNDKGENENGGKDCLAELLGDSTVGAKEAEFLKEAEARLKKLADGFAAEDANYRAKYSELLERWKVLTGKIHKLKEHFSECFDYKCFIDRVVCKQVVCREWELRRKLLGEKLCGRYAALYLAKEDAAEAGRQLDAWEKLAAWLKDRLDKNEKLYEEICKLDNCDDRYFGIYILFFELIPAHEAMGPPPEFPVKANPAEKYCTSTCGTPPPKGPAKLCGYPWLIDPDDYNCKLADVWKAWREAGLARVKAQCDVDEIENCKKLYEEIATNDARRKAAKDAFDRFDPECCKKKSQEPGRQQQSPYGQ